MFVQRSSLRAPRPRARAWCVPVSVGSSQRVLLPRGRSTGSCWPAKVTDLITRHQNSSCIQLRALQRRAGVTVSAHTRRQPRPGPGGPGPGQRIRFKEPECGEVSVCPHQRQRIRCKECGGASAGTSRGAPGEKARARRLTSWSHQDS